MKNQRARAALALVWVAACKPSSTSSPLPPEAAAPASASPAWVEQDRGAVELAGEAWAAWARGDRAALKKASEALCPPEHCAARRHAHMISRIEGAPHTLVTNLGLIYVVAGEPKRFVPMALGTGSYGKAWVEGRVIVDSPRFRRAYVVHTESGAVNKVMVRQPSDGNPSLLDVSPNQRSYVYVASDGHGWEVSHEGLTRPFGPLTATGTPNAEATIPTGSRVFWAPAGWPARYVGPTEVVPPDPYEKTLRSLAPPEVKGKVEHTYFACEKRLAAVCDKRRCFVGMAKAPPDYDSDVDSGGTAYYGNYDNVGRPKFFLTLPDPTPDLLDGNAGFGFVDGEHHDVVLLDCKGQLRKRRSTFEEEEHHVTAEAEAWRTALSPKLCTARDAVLPAAACDELDVKPEAHVP